jgi:hypothetical protein
MNTFSSSDEIKLLIGFFAEESVKQYEFCNSLNNKTFLISCCDWKKTQSPFMFLSDLMLDKLNRHIPCEEELSSGKCVSTELASLFQLLFDASSNINYMWYIYKSEPRISGYADHIWDIIRRLASEFALVYFYKKIPVLNFPDLDKLISEKMIFYIRIKKEQEESLRQFRRIKCNQNPRANH